MLHTIGFLVIAAAVMGMIHIGVHIERNKDPQRTLRIRAFLLAILGGLFLFVAIAAMR